MKTIGDQALAHVEHLAVGRYPGVIKVESWPVSDHYVFYSHGVPSIALTSRGIRDIYHTLSDTIEWITSERLAEATRLVLDLFKELDDKDGLWSRPTK